MHHFSLVNSSDMSRSSCDLFNLGKALFISAYMVLMVATIFGNVLVLRGFYSFRNLRTVSNTILVSLSVADCLMGVVFVLDIINVATEQSLRKLCHPAATLHVVLICVIILHLSLISVDRFIAIRFALRYKSLVNKRRAVAASVVVWLWSAAVVIAFPELLRADNKNPYKSLRGAVHPCYKGKKPLAIDLPATAEAYLIFLVVSLFVIPLFIIVGSYSYILVVSYKQRKQINAESANIHGAATVKREMKGARTVAMAVGICLVTVLPLLVFTFHRFLSVTPDNKCVFYILYSLSSINACLNPLIYCWRNNDFRSAFRKILNCKRS